MREQIIEHVVRRLRRESDQLNAFFNGRTQTHTRYFVVDDLLPLDWAQRIYKAFPSQDSMRLLSSYREKKFTTKSLGKLDPILSDATFALQSPEVIEATSQITGIRDMSGDPHLYAGGLSAMARGHFLNPHIDNSHDSARKLYRAVNALYYVSPAWLPSYGGSLELWDMNVRKPLTIPSQFNRLVVMETNRRSWHSVSPVEHDGLRCCVSNYYFTPHSPENRDYFHVTEFTARPEQPMRRALALADNALRTWIRRVKREGFAKTDLYQ